MMDDKTKSELEELIEPDYGLLDFFLKSGTLSRREIKDIQSVPSTFERNRKLLNYIEAKDAVKQLKIALAEGNQMHLVNFINSAGVYREEFGDDWPLSNNEKRVLDFNQGKLLDIIVPTELIAYLYSRMVINSRQRTILKSMANDILQNQMLIDICRTTSRKNFLKIIECLKISGQEHIGNILRNGGVIFDLHVTMNREEEERIETTENRIVKSMKRKLRAKSLEEQARIREVVQLENDDVQLIGTIITRMSASVALYFHCTTLQGLVYLHHLMSSGRLKKKVEAVFNEVPRSCDAAKPETTDEDTLDDVLKGADDHDVFTVLWPNDSYDKCKHFLQEDTDLVEKRKSSKLIVAHEQENEMTKCCVCTQTFNNPRSLPCVHTFCLKCLERCAENKSPGERIACPSCRHQWKIPVNGVAGFPRNYWVDKLVEISNTSGNASKAIACDVCNDNMEGADAVIPVAMKHCIECQQNMCKECSYHHSRQKPSRSHELIHLEGLDETERAQITSITCDKHPRKHMVIYCLNCQTTICQVCFDESHVGHKSEEVRSMAKRIQTDLDGVAESMASLAVEVKDVMTENPETLFLNRVSATEMDIRDRTEKVLKTVERHKERLLEYLSIVTRRIQEEWRGYAMDVNDLEIHLGEIRSVLKRIQDLKAQGSISDITGFGPCLLARAKELKQNHQSMCTKLKKQRHWPYADLVPLDLDDLLSYNSGNIVGKIRVNTVNTEDSDDYYTFPGSDTYEDECYEDCAYQPAKTDNQPQRPGEGKLEVGSNGQEIEEYDDEFESAETYTRLLTSETEDSALQRAAPPLPARSMTAPALLLASIIGNSKAKEISPSTINLERKLRGGKFTEIWLGRYNHVDDVAVKKFTDEATKESWIVKSDFFREAEILRGLQHENIVRLIGISSTSKPFYVVTETTSKGYLDRFLKEDKGVTVKPKDIVYMAKQIASAMHHLEINRCIHRYLAAKSILVGEKSWIKLTNFEMARILDEHETTLEDPYDLLESPMKTRAPEVIESQRWSIKSDVWSFGIVLYEMLTYGAEPYPDMDNTDLSHSILELHKVPCPAGENFTHPEKKLHKILQRCWIKHPLKRPDFKYLVGFFKDYLTATDTDNLTGYLESPDLVTSIKGKGAVTGVTVYDEETFLTRDNSSDIETFSGYKFKRGRRITVSQKPKSNRIKMFMSRASKSSEKRSGLQDVTCDRRGRLYTSESNGHRIYCIGLNTRQVISSWQVEAGKPSGLSVTKDSNLLVSCRSECKICEYTFSGDLVRAIRFGCNMDGPQHALQLDAQLLVVSHGNTDASQKSEGVNVIDLHGNISVGTKTFQLVNPSHLAVDSHQQILIADRARNMIILASRTLDGLHRILLTSENKLEAPTRIHLNEANGQLLVGLQNGTLMIYYVKSPWSIPDDAGKQETASLLSDVDDYIPGDEYATSGNCLAGDDESVYDDIYNLCPKEKPGYVNVEVE